MDAYLHVNNVAYAAYLQEARAEMLAAAGGPRRGPRAARDIRRRAAEGGDTCVKLTFRPEPVAVTTWVSAISPARITLRCEITEPVDDGSARTAGA